MAGGPVLQDQTPTFALGETFSYRPTTPALGRQLLDYSGHWAQDRRCLYKSRHVQRMGKRLNAEPPRCKRQARFAVA
jgi:hypothetical protein